MRKWIKAAAAEAKGLLILAGAALLCLLMIPIVLPACLVMAVGYLILLILPGAAVIAIIAGLIRWAGWEHRIDSPDCATPEPTTLLPRPDDKARSPTQTEGGNPAS